MTVPTRCLLAAAVVGLGLGRALPAQEPPKIGVEKTSPAVPLPHNQQVANAIAEQLKQNARLSGYKIDIAFQNGVADICGCVGNMPQKEEALRIVQGVPGVERVRDRLLILTPGSVAQVQAAMPPVADPAPLPRRVPDNGMGAGAAPPLPPGAIPMPGGGYPGATEPAPIYAAPGPPGGPYSLPAANMPPYAWPTYAPYNNYSRVASPSAYPYEAWPFIGPQYPFPKVPLGWRSVKLEWVDGHWWFGKTAQCHDWWRIRYW